MKSYSFKLELFIRYLFISSVLIILNLLFPLGIIKNAGITITAPLELVMMRVSAGISSAIEFQNDLHTIFNQNNVLKLENASLKGDIIKYSEVMKENEFLKKQLGIQEIEGNKIILGEVIGWQSNSIGRKMIINKGSEAAVSSGMPVVSNNFLIGRVDDVSEHSSSIEVITSPQSFIPAMISKADGNDKILAIAEGSFGFNLRLTQISQDAAVSPGDIVVTSGQGGSLPKGLILGTVEEVTQNQNEVYKQAKIIPAMSFEDIEHVVVVLHTEF